METNIKITRLYSNDSKKARLKRRKNKFQRVWDPEKQTYVKVRKQRHKSHFSKAEMKVRFGTKIESAPAAKASEQSKRIEAIIKDAETAEIKVVHAKDTGWKNANKAVTIQMNGKILMWDDKINRYREAA